MKEAIYFQKIGGQRMEVRCRACAHSCLIPEGKRGICGTRENIRGTLYALNYGKTIALHIDPIEKKPLYRFLPGSMIYSFAAVGCNFHCSWCQNWEISQDPKPDKTIRGQDITAAEHVDLAVKNSCPAIACTYSEPTVFLEYAFDVMQLAAKKGLKNVWVTNGYLSDDTIGLILPYLDAVNIDFKGPDEEFYRRYCGGSAAPVMNTIKKLYAAGVHVEITTLIIPGLNDKAEQIKQIAAFLSKEISLEVPWHISRFFPAWKMSDLDPTPYETLYMAENLGKRAGLKNIYLGNIR